jgi:hypothetical protein
MRMDTTESGVPRRVPALISYLHPFRLVTTETHQAWDISIDQVNNGAWDYVKLHEIVGGLDVGLAAPYHMVVCFDGALALPPIPALRSVPSSVEFFNRCLGAILIGGIYCEAVSLDHVETGSILDWKYLRASGMGTSSASQFHNLVRTRMAPPVLAIQLLNPRRMTFLDLQTAAGRGFEVLKAVPELTPEFLLKGVTAIARQDWSSALSSLWVVVEQLTSHLWERDILAGETIESVSGRQAQLKDNRSWTAANKQEVLHQKGSFDVGTLRALFAARKARNELMHTGKHPTQDAGNAAFGGVKGLLLATTRQSDIPLFSLDLGDHRLSDPFRQPTAKEMNVEYWMPFPKLPNEEDIEREMAIKSRE